MATLLSSVNNNGTKKTAWGTPDTGSAFQQAAGKIAQMQAETDAREEFMNSLKKMPSMQWRSKMFASKLFNNKEIDEYEKILQREAMANQNRQNLAQGRFGSERASLAGPMSDAEKAQTWVDNNAPWQPAMDAAPSDKAKFQGLYAAAGNPDVPYGGYDEGQLMGMADTRNFRSRMNSTARPGYVANASMSRYDAERPQAWQDYKRDSIAYMNSLASNDPGAFAPRSPGAWVGGSGNEAAGDTFSRMTKAAAGGDATAQAALDRMQANTQKRSDRDRLRQANFDMRNGVPLNSYQGEVLGALTGGPEDQNQIPRMVALGLMPPQVAEAQQVGVGQANMLDQQTKIARQRIISRDMKTLLEVMERLPDGDPRKAEYKKQYDSLASQSLAMESGGDYPAEPTADLEYEALKAAEIAGNNTDPIKWADALRAAGWPFEKIEAEGKKRWSGTWDKRNWSFMQRANSGGLKTTLPPSAAHLNIGLK